MPADDADSVDSSLNGLRVCAFESRKGHELRSLLERHGALVTIAPSMREVPLEQNPQVFAFAERLFAGEIEILILLTGVGTRALAEALAAKFDRAKLLAAMESCTVIVRGPKPAAVLREWKVGIDWHVPEPNTWRELLALLDANVSVAGKSVAVQEYGEPNDQLYCELAARGARVTPVPVYRWALPENTKPLEDAIGATIDGRFDVLMFTSAQQVRNVLSVAQSLGLRDAWLKAAQGCAIASIGPTASDTLVNLGLPPDIEPEHPKMGHLVLATAHQARNVLSAKRHHALP
ncbi:MAG: uroporphyrinogen-III synthase [Planctomycetaceae bacterium]